MCLPSGCVIESRMHFYREEAAPPAPTPRCMFPPVGKEHRTAITVPEFKSWLKQFDTDNDGRISRKELQEAIRRRGAWFSGLRAMFAVRRADRNRDGFVDDSEIEGLIDLAERELGFKITTDGFQKTREIITNMDGFQKKRETTMVMDGLQKQRETTMDTPPAAPLPPPTTAGRVTGLSPADPPIPWSTTYMAYNNYYYRSK